MKSSFSWLLAFLASWLLASAAFAQMDMGSMLQTGLMRIMRMNSALLPDLPMSRDGSGTSWLPDNSPMYAIRWGDPNWSFMLHGNFSARYVDAGRRSQRGGTAFDGPNWIMLMANHPFALHREITLRGMWSLDPLTEGNNGYPLLFQTGESLVDRQHPHDFFSELAVIYGHTFSRRSGYFLYAAYPGEPALGPPAFMHRPSATSILDAPLGHHWQDATHISFGVGTVGFRYHIFKLDGSIFTGREPNSQRWDFDKPRFDSYSARLSANPNSRWALQVSGGYLKSPEELEPDVNLYRTTASAIYAVSFRDFNHLAVSTVWGMNKIANSSAVGSQSKPQHSVLVESNLRLDPYDFFGRTEWVQKTALDLRVQQIEIAGNSRFGVGIFSLGLDRDILHYQNVRLLAGAQGSMFSVPNKLRSIYGQAPFSVEVFLRLTPSLMVM